MIYPAWKGYNHGYLSTRVDDLPLWRIKEQIFDINDEVWLNYAWKLSHYLSDFARRNSHVFQPCTSITKGYIKASLKAGG